MSLLAAVNRADELGRVLEGIGLSIDHHLTDDWTGIDSLARHRLREDVADLTHTLGAQHVERGVGTLQGELSDLRAVAVRQHDLVARGPDDTILKVGGGRVGSEGPWRSSSARCDGAESLSGEHGREGV